MVEAGIGDTFRGMGNSIGNMFSSIGGAMGGIGGGLGLIQLIVNTVIIGIFLYIVLNVTGITFGENKSRTSKFIFVIVIIFLAGALAFKIGNQWIWQEGAFIQPLFRFLFSGEEPLGILRPTRILIFIGATLILSWLFVSTIKIGQGKNKIDIAIATLLSADMTHQGLTSNWLVTLGQIISIWLLYRQFKKEGDAGWSWAAAVSSAGLVVWISAIAFPGKGFFAVRWMGEWFKTIGLYGSMVFIIILVVVLTAVGLFRNKQEDKARARLGWTKNTGQYIGQRFINLANKIRFPIIGWLLKKADLHDITPGAPEKEEFSFSIRKVWMEMFAMMNYLLRLEVYHAKGGAVEKTKNKTIKLFGEKKVKIYSKHTLHIWFDIFKNGTGYRKIEGGTPGTTEEKHIVFEADNEKRSYMSVNNNLDEEKFKHEGFYGWVDGRFIIFRFLELFKRDIEGITKNSKVEHEREELKGGIEIITKGLKGIFDQMADSKRRYTLFVTRISAINVIDSYRSNILNQLNKYGSLYRHNYKFAKKGARIYNVTCDVDKSKDQPFGDIEIYPETATYSGNKVYVNLKHEVNLHGCFLEDWNKFRMENSSGRKTIRKVELKDVADHPDFREVSRWQAAEWDFFIKDVRDGRFHPSSRTVSDYTEIHSKKRKYNYRGVKATHGAPRRGNVAFDREALKDIGRFVYLGRKNADDEREDDVNVPISNPFPAITTIGLSTYINDYIDEFAKESGKKQKRKFAWETGKEPEEELFTNYPDNKGGD